MNIFFHSHAPACVLYFLRAVLLRKQHLLHVSEVLVWDWPWATKDQLEIREAHCDVAGNKFKKMDIVGIGRGEID